MSSSTRQYTVCAMTLPEQATPWHWQDWRGVLPALDRLFSGKETAVRSFQNEDSKNRPSRIAGETILGGYVKFGALRWNDASHEKWTHGSPRTQQSSSAWRFFRTDFSSPSLRTFDKTGVPPDRFGKLSGAQRTLAADGGVLIRPPSFFVALAHEDAGCAELDSAIRDVARGWRATCVARRQRAWAFDASEALQIRPGVAVTGSIQDSTFAHSQATFAEQGWDLLDPASVG